MFSIVINSKTVKYSGYKSGVSSISIDSGQPSMNSGKTFLAFIRIYASSASVLNNVYIITLLDNSTWVMSPISEESQSGRPASISNSNSTLTFTFNNSLYGSLSLLSIML